ncbi:MAG: hypothetical protein RLP02_32170, partial [Coleofasciculus sp. C2-GNP5-27]
RNETLAQAGNLESIPPTAPPTLFVWGDKRVLPVRLTSFSITEEAYDALLNPIRANVELSLLVLSYVDLSPSQVGHYLFLTHQIQKEVMATTNVFNSVQNIGSGLKLL